MNELPENFAIRQCNNPLWKIYIEWLNREYSFDFLGSNEGLFYGYEEGTVVCERNLPPNVTLITLEE